MRFTFTIPAAVHYSNVGPASAPRSRHCKAAAYPEARSVWSICGYDHSEKASSCDIGVARDQILGTDGAASFVHKTGRHTGPTHFYWLKICCRQPIIMQLVPIDSSQ